MYFIIRRNLTGNRLKAFAATDKAAGNKQKDYLSHVHSVPSFCVYLISLSDSRKSSHTHRTYQLPA